MTKPIEAMTPQGEAMIVLTRSDYDALLREAGRSRLSGKTAPRSSGDSEIIPFHAANALAKRLRSGEHPIRVFRTHAGLTQAELAARVGINKLYVSQLERGDATGSIKTLTKIARAINVEPIDLISVLRFKTKPRDGKR